MSSRFPNQPRDRQPGTPTQIGEEAEYTDKMAAAPTDDFLPEALPTDRTLQSAADTGALATLKGSPLGHLGRYELLEYKAAGAMGEIYIAYDAQLDRKLALKVLRPEVRRRSDHASQRLLREAQSLAQVSHPNVVPVYEAGEIDGRVFVAMELVAGEPLGRWLAKHAPPAARFWRSILDTFLEAGRGLAAVHEAGLLHRDFKPDNVLVGDDGRVRVVDFGLARASNTTASIDERSTTSMELEPHASAQRPRAWTADLTRSGVVVGTPAYMAPEQIRGGTVDARSDQFSYCVALYEALYGHRPFRGEDFTSLRASVLSGEVLAPSASAKVPSWVWRVLLRGLATEPEQRYPDMHALLSALSADPARKRRQRGTAVALLFGGTAAGVLATMLASEHRDERCTAAAESALEEVWTEATRNQVRAAFAASTLPYAATAWQSVDRGIQDYIRRWQHSSIELCESDAEDGLDGTADGHAPTTLCLDTQAERLQLLVTELVHADAHLVENASSALAFLGQPEACGTQFSSLPPAPDAQTRDKLSQIRTAMSSARLQAIAGSFDPALRQLDDQIEAAESLSYEPVLAEALYHAGDARLERGREDEIETGTELLKRALDIAESSGNDALATDIWNALARRREATLPPEQIAFWSRRALALTKRMSSYDQRRAQALRNLGTALYRSQQYTEAEVYQRRAIDLARSNNASPLLSADMLHALANTLHALAKYDDARVHYEEALALADGELGRGHPKVQALRFDFADFLIETAELSGDDGKGALALDQARTFLDTARTIRAQVYGPQSPQVAAVHVALAKLETKSGALDEAAYHAGRAIDFYRAHYGEHAPQLAEALSQLGFVQFRSRRYKEALVAWQQESALREQSGALPIVRGLNQSNIAEALVHLRRYDEAFAAFERAQEYYGAEDDISPIYSGLVEKGRGQALLGQGRAAAAVPHLEAALAVFHEHPFDVLEDADTAWSLARALRISAPTRLEEARSLATKAEDIYRANEATRDIADEIRTWLDSL
ncbi:serine/threonine-protein kinase [Haliangium ochraceum]|uniref:Serine/threonine protein kinase with TPR repeats n=1 Tax=Haliangium ochraceum (strain DSM 14365 / JCM 11303 / SMP-2) TaxID=502025 RepID=D0LYG7_HALO1|nr:serine/threonine-protein kinase [Haliangium ochraceum]ACY17833.1 serine/threonine protein kinase with TPR repeats [Haliangium ochraceum DSM 14365]